MEFGLLDDIIVIFIIAIIVSLVCGKLKLPATVGFLFTGILCGPSLLGVVHDKEAIDIIAEIGVSMLLFTIGMELSGDSLNRLKRPVFLGGGLQIGVTIIVMAGVSMLFGANLKSSIFWGCLAALSSSAIVLRIMQEKHLTPTPPGRLALGMLVFQDIMVAPMLLSVPLLSGQLHMNFWDAFSKIMFVALVLGAVIFASKLWLNRLIEIVVKNKNREIMLMTTLGICMGMAFLTEKLGLSLSLGAFLAGLLLARSHYSMSVISGIMPYRDVFMSIFFISVGMMLNLQFAAEHIVEIALYISFFVVLKILCAFPAVLAQGYHLGTAIVASFALAQVGEFSFVLAAQGQSAGLLTQNSYQIFLAVSVFTMMLTPGLIAIAPKLAAKFKCQSTGCENKNEMADHMIIIGFGPSGKQIAHSAKESNIDYVVLEMNPETVKRYKDIEPITHGDASQPIVLEHLGVEKAKTLVIVISDQKAVRCIAHEAKKLNPDIHIIARAKFATEMPVLQKLGVDQIIIEEVESSIQIIEYALKQYDVPKCDIEKYAEEFKENAYGVSKA